MSQFPFRDGVVHYEAGDLMIISTAGAYGATMASTYNSRALIPEVLVNGTEWAGVRERRDPETFLRDDHVPAWIGVSVLSQTSATSSLVHQGS